VKLYLCSGNRTGIASEDGWEFVDLPRDVRTLRPEEFPGLSFVFATPPCNGFTDLPWRPATGEGLDVLLACWDFCQDAGVPWLLENSRFAQKYLGPSDFHRGPHHFWGRGVGLIPDFYRVKMNVSGMNPLKRAALPRILP